MKKGDKVRLINLDNSALKETTIPIGSVGIVEEVRPDDESSHPIAVYFEGNNGMADTGWFLDRENLEIIEDQRHVEHAGDH